jgi:hypothetical protein
MFSVLFLYVKIRELFKMHLLYFCDFFQKTKRKLKMKKVIIFINKSIYFFYVVRKFIKKTNKTKKRISLANENFVFVVVFFSNPIFSL